MFPFLSCRASINHLRWQLTADHNERPNPVYNNSSLSLRNSSTPDRNYREVINPLLVSFHLNVLKAEGTLQFRKKKVVRRAWRRRSSGKRLISLQSARLSPNYLLPTRNVEKERKKERRSCRSNSFEEADTVDTDTSIVSLSLTKI